MTDFPKRPMRFTVYRHFNADGDLLYVGMARDPFKRLTGHAQESSWFDEIAMVTIKHFATKKEALRVEGEAIDSEGPRHNSYEVVEFNPTPEQEDAIKAVWLDEARSLADRCQAVADIYGARVARFTLYRRYGKPGAPKE